MGMLPKDKGMNEIFWLLSANIALFPRRVCTYWSMCASYSGNASLLGRSEQQRHNQITATVKSKPVPLESLFRMDRREELFWRGIAWTWELLKECPGYGAPAASWLENVHSSRWRGCPSRLSQLWKLLRHHRSLSVIFLDFQLVAHPFRTKFGHSIPWQQSSESTLWTDLTRPFWFLNHMCTVFIDCIKINHFKSFKSFKSFQIINVRNSNLLSSETMYAWTNLFGTKFGSKWSEPTLQQVAFACHAGGLVSSG